MNITNSFSACSWIALASSLAILISEEFDDKEIDILASFFSALGDNLGIISASK